MALYKVFPPSLPFDSRGIQENNSSGFSQVVRSLIRLLSIINLYQTNQASRRTRRKQLLEVRQELAQLPTYLGADDSAREWSHSRQTWEYLSEQQVVQALSHMHNCNVNDLWKQISWSTDVWVETRRRLCLEREMLFLLSLSFPCPFKNRPIQLRTLLRTRLSSRVPTFSAKSHSYKSRRLITSVDWYRTNQNCRVGSHQEGYDSIYCWIKGNNEVWMLTNGQLAEIFCGQLSVSATHFQADVQTTSHFCICYNAVSAAFRFLWEAANEFIYSETRMRESRVSRIYLETRVRERMTRTMGYLPTYLRWLDVKSLLWIQKDFFQLVDIQIAHVVASATFSTQSPNTDIRKLYLQRTCKCKIPCR